MPFKTIVPLYTPSSMHEKTCFPTPMPIGGIIFLLFAGVMGRKDNILMFSCNLCKSDVEHIFTYLLVASMSYL